MSKVGSCQGRDKQEGETLQIGSEDYYAMLLFRDHSTGDAKSRRHLARWIVQEIKDAVAKERERCATIAEVEAWAIRQLSMEAQRAAIRIAEEIRS